MVFPGFGRSLMLGRHALSGIRAHSTKSGTSSNTSGGRLHPVLQAGLISGSMSVIGDMLAQRVTGAGIGDADLVRTSRMGGYGLCIYGPLQHFWYRALHQKWPLATMQHFLSKVAMNQFILGPIVLTSVFSWNLLLQRQPSKIPDKLKEDLVPGAINGWKFWVPAASVNFWLVPLKHQVLYMSVCSILWTAYLSVASASGARALEKRQDTPSLTA